LEEATHRARSTFSEWGEFAHWTDVDIVKAATALCEGLYDIQIIKAIGLPAEKATLASSGATTNNAPKCAPVDDNNRAKRR